MKPQLAPETPKWIDKHQAAKRLGVTWSRVLDLAKQGRIQSKKEYDPKLKQNVIRLHAGDVERFLYEREHPEQAKALVRVVAAPLATSPPPVAPLLPAPVQPPTLPAVTRPWLTLDEAAEFSGLTKRWLVEQAEGTVGIAPERLNPLGVRIIVRDMGKHAPGRRWRFHRESLEKA